MQFGRSPDTGALRQRDRVNGESHMYGPDWPLTAWIALASITATVCWRCTLLLVRLLLRSLRRYAESGARRRLRVTSETSLQAAGSEASLPRW